ncbi:hypothetical protein ACFFZC_003129 [Enterobacter hormaechei]|nr:hypothetical protein [Enterobacter hormaechei]
MSVKRYSVWEDEMFDEKHALNPKNSMVHLMVMHEDYAALEVRCAALAADNGILLAIMNEQAGSFGAALAEGFHDAVMESGSDQLIDIYQRRLQQAIQCIPPTTSTDAFLAEVRAQESKRVYESILDNPAVTDMESLVDWLEQYASDSVAFAAQLRKGVQS